MKYCSKTHALYESQAVIASMTGITFSNALSVFMSWVLKEDLPIAISVRI